MKERPIIFSAPMVRAILEGRKTMTRRVVNDRHLRMIDTSRAPMRATWTHPMPYGKPGDRLWVRETFQPLFADGFEHGDERIDWGTGAGYAVRYMATDSRIEWVDGDDAVTDRCKPSIHMPRWASRILLEVTEVRVERLNAITVDDVWLEGVQIPVDDATKSVLLDMSKGGPTKFLKGNVRDWKPDPQTAIAVAHFAALWESINGPDSWALNPWVWVVSFRKLDSLK